MTQPNEQPEEMHEDHVPAGTPVARQVAQNAASVWDRDGTEWQPVEGGYAAVTTDPVKGRLLVMDVGAIPEEYQPTYAQPPTVQQRQLADLADEIEGEHPL